MAFRDEIFEAVNLADRNSQHQYHGKSRVDRTGHEVGREDGGMPAGHDTDGEVETHHGVDG